MAILGGIVAAILTITAVTFMVRKRTAHFFALLLSAAAAVYVGGAFAEGLTELRIAIAGFFGFVLLAMFGMDRRVWLGRAWLLHALWDLLHHNHLLQTTVPDWYQVACCAADIVWAAYLLLIPDNAGPVVKP